MSHIQNMHFQFTISSPHQKLVRTWGDTMELDMELIKDMKKN